MAAHRLGAELVRRLSGAMEGHRARSAELRRAGDEDGAAAALSKSLKCDQHIAGLEGSCEVLRRVEEGSRLILEHGGGGGDGVAFGGVSSCGVAVGRGGVADGVAVGGVAGGSVVGGDGGDGDGGGGGDGRGGDGGASSASVGGGDVVSWRGGRYGAAPVLFACGDSDRSAAVVPQGFSLSETYERCRCVAETYMEQVSHATSRHVMPLHRHVTVHGADAGASRHVMPLH